jgi:hypothetical protein
MCGKDAVSLYKVYFNERPAMICEECVAFLKGKKKIKEVLNA